MLSAFDFRLLETLKDFEPSLTEEVKSFIALLLAFRTRGDTRIPLDAPSINKLFNIKVRPVLKAENAEEVNAFLELCLLGASSLTSNFYPAIIGTETTAERPLILADQSLYIQKYYVAKESILKKVKTLFPFNTVNAETTTKTPAKMPTDELHFLHEHQLEAVCRGISQNLIITGGPGTGKTTVVLYLLKALLTDSASKPVYLAAPSGKAASRMQESIKSHFSFIESKTIHRLLRFNPRTNSFFYNAQNQFPLGGIFIIDEASMIDIEMFARLLEAIPEGSRLFLLGDENQLPSVDVGAVLGDLLSSLCAHAVVRLTHSYRSNLEIQALANTVNEASEQHPFSIALSWSTDYQSLLQTKAKITAFLTPSSAKSWSSMLEVWVKKHYLPFENTISELETHLQKSPLFLISKTEHPELALLCDRAWKMVTQAKILCAERRGPQGTFSINEIMSTKLGRTSLIMMKQNLYSYSLYNGDTGLVVFVNQTPYVLFERPNGYEKFPLSYFAENTYESAYAMTIHKSQGSEFDHVMIVLPSDSEHPLLSKQIIYTGITRAKEHVAIVSNEGNLAIAAAKKESRETGLL